MKHPAKPRAGIAFLLSLLTLCACHEPAAPTFESYEALYRSGRTYQDFLEDAQSRRPRWLRNTANASIATDLLERARASGGPFYLLAVAVDGCSDSVSTIPYLARLVADTEGLEMRIVDSDAGREVMLSHRTPDGRPATPTVLILDKEFKEVGVFVERPVELQAWAVAAKDSLEAGVYLRQKFAWYDSDLGSSTIEEVVALMEASRVPDWIRGAFVDDYGIRYDIGGSTWIQSAGSDSQAVLHVTEWDAENQFAVARNGAQNDFAPGRWTRIDWMSLEDVDNMGPYTWAFCLTVFDAPDAAAARSAHPPDRMTPRTGCAGHPFSRMKPAP